MNDRPIKFCITKRAVARLEAYDLRTWAMELRVRARELKFLADNAERVQRAQKERQRHPPLFVARKVEQAQRKRARRDMQVMRLARRGLKNDEIRQWLADHGFGSFSRCTIGNIIRAGIRESQRGYANGASEPQPASHEAREPSHV